MCGMEYDAPQGRVKFDGKTHDLVQLSRVGSIKNGRFEDEFTSPSPIMPEPFPQSRDRQAWEDLVQGYFKSWGNRWHNAGVREAE